MGRDLVALLSKRNAAQRGGGSQAQAKAASASSSGVAPQASASSSGASGSRQQKVDAPPDSAKAKLLSIYGPKKRNPDSQKNKGATAETDDPAEKKPKAKAKSKSATKSKAKPPNTQVPVETPQQDQVSQKGMKRPAAAVEHGLEDDELDDESPGSDDDSANYPPKSLSWLHHHHFCLVQMKKILKMSWKLCFPEVGIKSVAFYVSFIKVWISVTQKPGATGVSWL